MSRYRDCDDCWKQIEPEPVQQPIEVDPRERRRQLRDQAREARKALHTDSYLARNTEQPEKPSVTIEDAEGL